MNDVDVAWAAGLFEGEGSVHLHKTNKAPRLSMTMTDEDVMRRFTEIVDGKLYGPQHYHYELKPRWMWGENKLFRVQEVLRLFWPCLGERRRSTAALVFAQYYEADIIRKPRRV